MLSPQEIEGLKIGDVLETMNGDRYSIVGRDYDHDAWLIQCTSGPSTAVLYTHRNFVANADFWTLVSPATPSVARCQCNLTQLWNGRGHDLNCPEREDRC